MFEAVDKADPNLEFSIKISYVEIYMETIRDLLEPSSINLQLREDKERGIFIDKARSIYVSSAEEMMEVIAAGAENREVRSWLCKARCCRVSACLPVDVTPEPRRFWYTPFNASSARPIAFPPAVRNGHERRVVPVALRADHHHLAAQHGAAVHQERQAVLGRSRWV